MSSQTVRPFNRLALSLALLCAWCAPPAPTRAQEQPPEQKKDKKQAQTSDDDQARQLGKKDRSRGHDMLKEIKKDVEQFYYDKTFRGVDLDARFKLAHEKVDAAQSLGQMFGVIAQLLIEFDDSHTFFIPPRRSVRTVYGWEMSMIGDDCLVTDVSKDSDAAAKGLKRGDKVLWLDGYTPARENFWKLKYLFDTLRPQPALNVFVQSPGEAQPRPLTLVAKYDEPEDLYDLFFGGGEKSEQEEKEPPKADPERETHFGEHRFHEFKDGPVVWQMPEFDLSEGAVDKIMREKIAPHTALVLDLRGNPGGYEITLLRLLGHFFDKDVRIGEIQRRKGVKQLSAKARGDKAYTGKLVVLVDSGSASSAEIFARTIQLEKRGVVLGDRTAGAVMRALQVGHFVDEPGMMTANLISYGISVTDADLIMTDGKSLERNGVAPDERLLPTPADLAALRDPVLARALELAGLKLDADKAGALFPPREPKPKKKKKEKDKDKDKNKTGDK
ncbi:MAG TPA: S41 family peptidase [Pyrinomonadaceae bacterium]|jgi:carboxyl-terminal processing protease